MSKNADFEPWPIDWKPEFTQRYWDWTGTNPSREENYFSNRVGDAILDEVKKHINLSGVAVDIGAGPGFLVEKLIARGVECIAVDTSAKSVEKINSRLRGRPHFVDARLNTINKIPIADGVADVVFLIEVVEHMSDDVIAAVLQEAKRITRSGGYLVITTPNDEDLSKSETMCPNCGCVYHIVQHMRSFNADQLKDTCQSIGYTTKKSYPVLFSQYKRWLRPLQYLSYKATKRDWPHLLYIGAKRI